MKHITAIITLIAAFIQPAMADDPGPLAPCYALLSNGWEILRLRNAGLPLEEFIARVEHAKASPEDKADMIAFIREAYQAPGDGWDWIGDQHRACIVRVRYGQ